jgi:hypothetical protein
MIGRPPSGLGNDTVEAQCRQIQFVDKRFNNPDRVVLRHVVILAVREQRSLPPQRPTMRFVSMKSETAQANAVVFRARDLIALD